MEAAAIAASSQRNTLASEEGTKSRTPVGETFARRVALLAHENRLRKHGVYSLRLIHELRHSKIDPKEHKI